MLNWLAPFPQVLHPPRGLSRALEQRFDGLVAHEEERCAGGRADESGANAGVDAAEAAGGIEARGGLEARFECVDGVEGEVDCCAC